MLLHKAMMAAKLTMPRHSVVATCKQIGVTTSVWYKWENSDKTGNLPNPANVVKIAKMAGVDPAPILFEVLALQYSESGVKDWFLAQAGQSANLETRAA